MIKIIKAIIDRWKTYKQQRKLRNEWMWIGGKSAYKTTKDFWGEQFNDKR